MLGLIPQGDTGGPEEASFHLHSSRIREDHFGSREGSQKLPIAERRDTGQEGVIKGPHLCTRPRMHRKNQR